MDDRKLFMSSATVGPKGQIVIPKEIRQIFSIKPGDKLIVMADSTRGIAIQKQEIMEKMADAIFAGQGDVGLPQEPFQSQKTFALAIHETCEREKDNECD